MDNLPHTLPSTGIGGAEAIERVAQWVNTRSAMLGAPDSLAHMDPPPPDVAARLAGLCAAHNQNMLHPDLSPFASEAEERVMDWMCAGFGMGAGHMCGGSTLANLEAIWCAREHGATTVVASAEAHLSVAKAAHILGMNFRACRTDENGRMMLPDTLAAADCLVLTAGTTGRGAVDPLLHGMKRGAGWVHVDAAWAGPLVFTRYADRLAGVSHADSVAVSAHKWLYQPKDSAMVMFARKDALEAVSFGGAYLARPNVGVQGSRGAAAVPLLGTLLAWGREGLAARIESNMAQIAVLESWVREHKALELLQQSETGVLCWRHRDADMAALIDSLGHITSSVTIGDKLWARQVAANPQADISAVISAIKAALP